MAPTNTSRPALFYGGGLLGNPEWCEFTTPEAVKALLDTCARLGVEGVDTAALYPMTHQGLSESLLGAAGVAATAFVLDTKVLTVFPDSRGTLTKAKVEESTAASVERLRLGGSGKVIDVLYCHTPDTVTPMEEQVEALEEQRRKGLCKTIGLSNFTTEQTQSWIDICQKKGYPLPTAYQGKYNLIEHPERSLMALLRAHGISFRAYSPLASGVLSLKARSKFDRQFGSFAAVLIDKYEQPSLKEAVLNLVSLQEKHDVGGTAELALRWLAFHSDLKAEKGDAIIMGASRLEQVESNVAILEKGPLPDELAEGVNEIGRQISSISG